MTDQPTVISAEVRINQLATENARLRARLADANEAIRHYTTELADVAAALDGFAYTDDNLARRVRRLRETREWLERYRQDARERIRGSEARYTRLAGEAAVLADKTMQLAQLTHAAGAHATHVHDLEETARAILGLLPDSPSGAGGSDTTGDGS